MSSAKTDTRKNVLKYSAKRVYFGSVCAADFEGAYKIYRQTRHHDKPVNSVRIKVGQIDGEVICKALLKEMSYNPKRFGTLSPFFHNGHENIFYFCRKEDSADECEALRKVRILLREFLRLNVKPHVGWYDKIDTSDGYLTLSFETGFTDDNYAKLVLLREAIKRITKQNEADFEKKEYRDEIIKAIDARKNTFGNGARKVESQYNADPQILTPEEVYEDRLDKAEESAQITVDTWAYRPDAQYDEMRRTLEYIASERSNKNGK